MRQTAGAGTWDDCFLILAHLDWLSLTLAAKVKIRKAQNGLGFTLDLTPEGLCRARVCPRMSSRVTNGLFVTQESLLQVLKAEQCGRLKNGDIVYRCETRSSVALIASRFVSVSTVNEWRARRRWRYLCSFLKGHLMTRQIIKILKKKTATGASLLVHR